MLSAQMDREFTADDYDGVKKVYSIWVCMNAPEKDANTITEYHMHKKDVYGIFRGKERYDLLSVIMIRLGKKVEDGASEIFRLLDTLLTSNLVPAEKQTKLEHEFGIPATVQLKEGLQTMCNLSYGIEENAIERKAKEMTIGMFKEGISLEVIARVANTTTEVIREWLVEAGLMTK